MTQDNLNMQIAAFKQMIQESTPEELEQARMIFAQLLGLIVPARPSGDVETVDFVGVKNGTETNLGKIPTPPSMKLKEIMRTYFSGSPDDEESEVSMAVAAGMEFFTWLESQGYVLQAPQAPSKPVNDQWIELR